jgi:hypothetical protein
MMQEKGDWTGGEVNRQKRLIKRWIVIGKDNYYEEWANFVVLMGV